MGVDFFDCKVCGKSVCECGHFVDCECGNKWCNEECAETDGYSDEKYTKDDITYYSSCNYCRNEDHEDIVLLDFALELLNKSRQDLIKMYNERLNK